MATFSIRFLGCKVSHTDAHDVRERLLGDGHLERPAELGADVAVVNTCCVTHEAVRKSRQAATRAALVHAIEIDEADRIARAVAILDTRPQSGGDEGEVGVRIARLHGALGVGQLAAAMQLIVLVGRALGKEPPEHVHVRLDTRAAACETRGEALLEISCSRVKRVIEAPPVGVEDVAVQDGGAAAHVDDVEARARRQLDRQLNRIGHERANLRSYHGHFAM